MTSSPAKMSRVEWAKEPFRVFFPAAVLAGATGVLLWPLHLKGFVSWYPGGSHAHLMAFGLFGGFMFGFLGTAFPRLLAVPPLGRGEIAALLLIYLAMVGCAASGNLVASNVALLLLLVFFSALLARRIPHRKDLPPPGFVLVILAFISAAASALLTILAQKRDLDPFWVTLQHLVGYQGFVLLPILGVGGFLLPRFFGRAAKKDFPESRTPPPGWTRAALIAAVAGLLIELSFFIEAAGWVRSGPSLRFAVTLAYLLFEIPVFRRADPPNALATCLRIAFVLLLAGFLFITLFPAYRVSLLHLTLIGGFSVITFTVATRVVFGHTGNQAKLRQRNRWLFVSVGLMLFAMATRISGDFWPKIMASHYIYGAILWVIGVLVWTIYVLPKIRMPHPDGS